MTGFAAEVCELDNVSLHLELRSVNSRYLDMFFRLSDELRQAEPAIRERLSARLKRGKIECRLNLQRSSHGGGEISLNTELVRQLQEVQARIQTTIPAAAGLSVGEVLRWPGVLADAEMTFEQMQPALLSLLDKAVEELVATRRREGDKLAAMIRERLARMRELVVQVEPRMPTLVSEYQEKLFGRLQEVIATLDKDRVFQEVALYAQRVDVAEELSRLVAHLDEVERILKTGGTVGKRLDFLMQELNREANTLASKSPAVDITAVAMEMKLLIEQMREQVQNIE